MKILGEGCKAVRLIRDEKGCEIRYYGMIIQCNEDLSNLLDIITSYSVEEGLPLILSLTKLSEEEALSQVRYSLIELEKVGIPLTTWGEDWINHLFGISTE